ncbi:MAG: amino acid adenylation domain-containing protein [bacterium]|nr:amino acid adenylation domain-containing protein [bacterium]
MRTVGDLLSHLQSLDVHLWMDDGKLRFNAPEGVLSGDLMDELRARKPELIAVLKYMEAPGSAPRFEKAPEGVDIPLSSSQERFWFLHQLEGAGAAYNISSVWRLNGSLNEDALTWALAQIARRHAVLRTAIPSPNGRPVQSVLDDIDIPLWRDDERGLPPSQIETSVHERIGAESSYVFDLAHAPLWRVGLLRLKDEEYLLFLTFHHIVADGWSMGVFVNELIEFYRARSENAPPDVKELPIQFIDYAYHQRRWMKEGGLKARLDEWIETLRGAPPLLALPTDRPRPPVQSFRGRVETFHIDAALLSSLNELSRRSGATLFMTLMTGLSIVLSRYSGQRDLTIGTPVANRPSRTLESLIGLFLNTLVFRIDLGDEPDFIQLLNRVRLIALDAYARQDVPFEEIVNALQPQRTLSYSPLFQVMLILQNAPASRFELPGLRIEPIPMQAETEKFDLTFSFVETGDGLLGEVGYSLDLFDAETVRRMAEHLRLTLIAMIEASNQPVFQTDWMTTEERRGVLHEWNATRAPLPEPLLIHQHIEEQARRTPEANALELDEVTVTYDELNRSANRLARYLRSTGVGVESRVGVCLERSFEMLIALLAVWKAGGAYVPLDPDYPQDRLSFMLDDSRVAAVITMSRHLDRLPESGRYICLDEESAKLDSLADTDLPPVQTPDNLAYVIYTSGSTGIPKGVMNAHRGVCNRLLWGQTMFPLTPRDRVVQKTPFSFDVSVWELFWPLMTGATLVIARPGGHRDAAYIMELVQRRKITVIHFVAPMLRVFLEQEGVERCRTVKRVFTSGEALPYETMTLFFQRLGAELHDLYGPTEAAIEVSHWACRPEYDRPIVPIGRPIQNVRLYVLDPWLNPCPVGVPGELFIGGVCVARGYHRRPALTGEMFLPDPYAPSPGARMYRTGDSVRWLPSGEIEFFGRLDSQIKIRGFRVELGEIEAALSSLPEVREAIVLLREDAPGVKKIVGYLLADKRGEMAILNSLKRKLPEYMVPSALLYLDEWPLSPNGKIDRSALPAPVFQSESARYTPPGTPVEKALADIWVDVLGVERAGLHDNFFMLGGDSIQSAQVIARARRAGYRLTHKQIFQNQTLAELASVAEPVADSISLTETVEGLLPLTPIQSYFFERCNNHPHYFNQAVFLEIPESVSIKEIERILNALIVRHDALRLRFSRSGEQWNQSAIDPTQAAPRLFEYDASGDAEQVRSERIAEYAGRVQSSLNVETGPIVAAARFNMGAGRPALCLIVIHHLAIDGVSWRVLFEEMEAIHRGEPLPPDISSSWTGWTRRLHEYTQSRRMNAAAEFWRSRTPVLSLIPHDFTVESDANTANTAESRAIILSSEDTGALLHQAASAYGVNVQETLLAALAPVLCEWMDTAQCLIHLEGHGRDFEGEGIDLSRTVGWFTTLYPVMLEPGDSKNERDLLIAMKEQSRRFARHAFEYGLLKNARPDEMSRWPHPQVAFNYLGRFDRSVASSSFILGFAEESTGPMMDPNARRLHELEIVASIHQERLRVQWIYSRALHRPETIESWMNRFENRLSRLIDHCRSNDAGALSPSEFSDVDLDQNQLDSVLNQLEFEQ